MTSFPTIFAMGFKGRAVGIPTNSDLQTPIGEVWSAEASGSNWQCYDACNVALTIVAGGTTTLNLLTGLTNPLGEAISAFPFAHIYGYAVNHDAESDASSITVFGGSSGNLFQGAWSATAKATLIPGRTIGECMEVGLAGVGQLVDATHKNIDIINLDGSNAATVNVIIIGTTN